ncbi:hypothetical protein ACCD02_21675 [Pseudomonas sp. Pseusp88]|uniref:hypothetical protein n=2 Tax=unclassified Pseudomonas TaxID=196821 RepID=UPI0039A59375
MGSLQRYFIVRHRMALLGIAYLMITMAANRLKREGLRLWLYRCRWGRGADPKWQGDKGHARQMRVLLETLQRPTVLGRALYYGGGSTPRQNLGFWVQIQLPVMLAGKEVTVQSAMIDRNYFSRDELQPTRSGFYEQFLNGNWIDPKQLGELPDAPANKINPADFAYTGTEQHRLWQVWINTSIANPILEMEVEYPNGVLCREDLRGYIFRLALEWATGEADRANNAFNGQLKEEDGIVLAHQSTQLLTLAVPE